MHTDDLDALSEPGGSVISLLPSYDPYTELADRKLLVADRAAKLTMDAGVEFIDDGLLLPG